MWKGYYTMISKVEDLVFELRMKKVLRNLADECITHDAGWRRNERCRIYDNSPFARDYLQCEHLKEGACQYDRTGKKS